MTPRTGRAADRAAARVVLGLALALAPASAACGGKQAWPGPGPIPPEGPAPPQAGEPLPAGAFAALGASSAPASAAAASAPARGPGVVGPEGVAAWDALPPEEKNKVKGAKVFFGHQSVGANTLEGIEALGGFTVREVKSPSDLAAPAIGHAYLEANTEPMKKMQSFERVLGSVGASVQVAAMKLCWIDFDPATNVGAIEVRYETTLGGLKARHKNVRFLHVTPPIKSDEPALNLKRMQFGEWLKGAYKNEAVVLDLAALQSTRPNGSSCTSGATRVMCTEYASDEGHLNAQGEQRAAKALLYAIYRSLP